MFAETIRQHHPMEAQTMEVAMELHLQPLEPTFK